MRIAFLPVSAALGGAERVLVELAEALRTDRPGWRLSAICPDEGPLAERLRAAGVTVDVVPFPAGLASLGESGSRVLAPRLLLAAPAALRYLGRLRAALRRMEPDVVHANGLKMHLLAALARPAGARLLWHLHDFLAGRPLVTRLLRLARSRCDGVIAVSRAVARDARESLGERIPVHLVPNRIDLTRFTPEGSTAPLAEMAGMPPETPDTLRVGLVATMGLWKGHETFLRALALVPPALAVRGYLVGGPIYRPSGSQVSLPALRSLATELGIADRVGFTGFVMEPAHAMRALDVVVHASTQAEPFGLVIAEAMACGRAVVVAHAGGAAELVEPGVDALAFSPGDAEALATCIAQLAGDAALRGRLGAAAQARALREFGRRGLADELERAYRSGEA